MTITTEHDGPRMAGSTDKTSNNSETAQRRRMFVSVDDLAEAHAEPGRPHFHERRKTFQKDHGDIVKSYFAPRTATGVVLVRVAEGPQPLGNAFQVHVTDSGALPPRLADLIRAVMHEKHRLASRIHGHARDIVVHDAYSLIVYLLTAAVSGSSPSGERALTATENDVRRELAYLRRFARDAARRTALWFYLMGLAVGVAFGMVLIVSAYHSTAVDALSDPSMVAACLAGGAVGAVISVMVRVTRGTTLDVDSTRGRVVLLLAGSFRPVIGAVFGAVLLVLTHGGLLPFDVPDGPAAAAGVDGSVCFFIGLAFLAGFSERWAQDTIVSSAPKVPPARQPASRPDGDAF
jgi:hypothetical protein